MANDAWRTCGNGSFRGRLMESAVLCVLFSHGLLALFSLPFQLDWSASDGVGLEMQVRLITMIHPLGWCGGQQSCISSLQFLLFFDNTAALDGIHACIHVFFFSFCTREKLKKKRFSDTPVFVCFFMAKSERAWGGDG